MPSGSVVSSMIGESLFMSGLSFAIASSEMSSRFSVENFAKDQKTLDNAMTALSTYIVIAIVWTLASCLVLFAQYGVKGIMSGLVCNVIFVGWIIGSYYWSFKRVTKQYGLQVPAFFSHGGRYETSSLPRRIGNE